MESSKKLVSISAIVSVALIAVIIVPQLFSSMEAAAGNNNLRPRQGLTLLYTLAPASETASGAFRFDSRVSDLNSNLRNVRFYVVLHRDYNEFSNELRSNNKIIDLKNIGTKICEVASKDAYLVVRIVSLDASTVHIDTTLSFVSGYARCGFDYSPLPAIDSQWNVDNSSYASQFKYLNVSRSVSIRQDTFEVESANSSYGEWPFWLRAADLASTNALILYSTDDTADVRLTSGTPIDGLASLVFLNLAQKAPTSYTIQSTVFAPEDQRYTRVGLLPPDRFILTAPIELKAQLDQAFQTSLKTCEADSGCSQLLQSRPYPPNIEFVNGSVFFDRNRILEMVSLSHKPWTYDARLTTNNSTLGVGPTSLTVVESIPGIRYGGSAYLSVGFPQLRGASYSADGILLYLRVDTSSAKFVSVLPTYVIRTFGIIPSFALTNSGQVSLMLIWIGAP